MGGVMPVPAVCGGAIETLIESVVKQYAKNDKFRLTIFSVYHKKGGRGRKEVPGRQICLDPYQYILELVQARGVYGSQTTHGKNHPGTATALQ